MALWIFNVNEYNFLLVLSLAIKASSEIPESGARLVCSLPLKLVQGGVCWWELERQNQK
jgi:hypothetical protein